jgi:hypothetical protein
MLFASLSRFFSLNENLNTEQFEHFKLQFSEKLAQEEKLTIDDVLALVIPLAAEEMIRDEVWERFADVVISNEHTMLSDRFQSCSNLAWAFSKVGYKGKHSAIFWKVIERTFRAELD